MMRFRPTNLAGAFVIEPEPHVDKRGFFARTFCAVEFKAQGLETRFDQCSLSFNHARGTLRGLHYQQAPAGEVKLVRCIAGALADVIVDLRPDSPTYLQHCVVELTAENRFSLYLPEMFAHGFQTLADQTEVAYQIRGVYASDKATGLRFDDPALKIEWPLPVTAISERDRQWPWLGMEGALKPA
jgi:dTDP-4-dehydrorhamnose 3,5-epimerase